jgi:hypothetical protein
LVDGDLYSNGPNWRREALPAPEPEPQTKESFWEKLHWAWYVVTRLEPALGGAILVGIIALVVIAALNIPSSPASITTGAAVVTNAPQVNMRNCPAASCGIVTTLNRGDPVTVTQSYDPFRPGAAPGLGRISPTAR